ncbi:hypothetical protein B0H14DRAFT_2634162 [Mycena olivaceomarginata]|nr:hypothetical protein B0H14DRAFT_2634162 [Mycena olivaceomarginata]
MDATTILGRRVNEGECQWIGAGGAVQGLQKRPSVWCKIGQNGLRKRSTRCPTCPLGRPVDRVWMGAAQGLRKGPCGGVKSPKTGCTSAALDVSMVVTSHHHGYIHVRQGGCNQPIWLQPSTWFQTTDLTPIGPTSPSLSGP